MRVGDLGQGADGDETGVGVGPGADPVASAFHAVADAAQETAKDAEELAHRSHQAEQDRNDGASVASTMASGQGQGVLALSEKMGKRLVVAGGGLRRALIGGLVKEGEGVGRISKLFGVSHQRISTLLRKPAGRGK